MAIAPFLFASASILPVVLIVCAAVFGGLWAVLAVLLFTVLDIVLDIATRAVTRDAPHGPEFPAGKTLLWALGLVHFPLLALVVAALTGQTGLDGAEQVALFLAATAWFGQVANSAGHELIHSRSRAEFRLGRLVFTSLLFGHHTSAHRLVHHKWVATDKDPNSAAKGTGFYRFIFTAWIGSFRAGLKAENDLRARQGRTTRLSHPYLIYLGGAGLTVAMVGLTFGLFAILSFLALCAVAQMQLMATDYVQHYGLRRAEMDGKPEPVSDAHSWNAPHPFTSAMLLHAPRHSDHHAHPSRAFTQLRLKPNHLAPELPASLPMMVRAAFIPPLWRRIMDHRADKWAPGRRAKPV